jgi:tRNA dimethylallyltransferase
MTRVLCIVGPTASGKSALAVDIARRLTPVGEIVSTDSMQIYQGMDIGTATPTAVERRGIPHHLLDRVSTATVVTVADYQRWAREAIDDVGSRGATPIVVGGSGLYVRAVLDDLQFPGTDEQVRARLEAELAQHGAASLHARLAQVDPAAALAIPGTNGRRIVRALEVVEITGKPFTAHLPKGGAIYDVTFVGLAVPRDEMDARIALRVDQMWATGFVDEVKSLGVLGQTARRALGYQQISEALEGRCTLDEARVATVEATRRFARRQQRWFQPDQRITWLAYNADDLIDQVLAVWGTST